MNRKLQSPSPFCFLCCCCKDCCTSRLPDTVYSSSTVLMSEENVPGSIVLRNFRSPNKRCNYMSHSIFASIAVTSEYLLVYQGRNTRPVIRVPWTDPRLGKLNFSIDTKRKKNRKTLVLVVDWDASLFQPTWSGEMKLRLCTEQTDELLQLIQQQQQQRNAAATK